MIPMTRHQMVLGGVRFSFFLSHWSQKVRRFGETGEWISSSFLVMRESPKSLFRHKSKGKTRTQK
jgi:hypothetical protein